MAFCRQVHDRVRSVPVENLVNSEVVTDIGLLESVVWALGDASDVLEVGRVGELVQVHHLVAIRNGAADHGRSDETGSAGDQDLHAVFLRSATRVAPLTLGTPEI